MQDRAINTSKKDLFEEINAHLMVSKLLGIPFIAEERGELTAEEVEKFTAGVKEILDEEKVPAEKQATFIKKAVVDINKFINATTEQSDEEALGMIADSTFAEIGDREVTERIFGRVFDLPALESVLKYTIEKSIETVCMLRMLEKFMGVAQELLVDGDKDNEKEQEKEEQKDQSQSLGQLLARSMINSGMISRSPSPTTTTTEQEEIQEKPLSPKK